MTFSYNQMDSTRKIPNLDLIGRQYRHYGNKKVYTVTGFAWMGERDMWGIVHQSEDGVQCVRSIGNFFETVYDECSSQPRFMPVENESHES
jgi:hypothetical protein